MMSMRLSASERETTILYTQDPQDEMAQINTSDPRLIHRLRRLGIVPDHEEREAGRVISAEFIIPRSWIKVSPPRMATESQRESARLAMQALNARRQEERKRPRRRRPAHKEG